jgi:hypothetical protein
LITVIAIPEGEGEEVTVFVLLVGVWDAGINPRFNLEHGLRRSTVSMKLDFVSHPSPKQSFK